LNKSNLLKRFRSGGPKQAAHVCMILFYQNKFIIMIISGKNNNDFMISSNLERYK